MRKTLVSFSLLGLALVTNLEAQQVMLRAHAGIGVEDLYKAGGGVSATVIAPGGKYNIGGRFTYHAGDTFTIPIGVGSADFDLGLYIFAAEFGAQWLSLPVIIRTVANVGAAWAEVAGPAGGSTTSEAHLALGPSLLVALPFGNGGFAGIEAKYWNVQDTQNSFAVYFTIGGVFGR